MVDVAEAEPVVAVPAEGAPAPAVHRFRAMGTDVEVVEVGGHRDPCLAAEAMIRDLEARWSRFRPDSDLCRLNRAAGAPVLLPATTYELVRDAIDWSRRTEGWFDPTVLPALEAAGYDRSFELLGRSGDRSADRPADEPRCSAGPTPGVMAIELDDRLRAVRLPADVQLDLGGIGKGRTADLVAEALHAGAGFCVNLGGDLRAIGCGPGGSWEIAVEDPLVPGRTVATIGLTAGAVATSSTARRTWTAGSEVRHHLIDPRTGRASARRGSVTCIAATATAAEVWAKAALLAGPVEGTRMLASAGVPALWLDDDGARPIAGMEEFLR